MKKKPRSYAREILDQIRDKRWSEGRWRNRVLKRCTERVPLDDDVWTPPSVDLLSVPQMLELPEIGGNTRRAGVYFLLLNGELQYVGSSNNVRQRVCTHDFYPEIRFDRATYLPIPWPWNIAIESLYIRRYSPPMNAAFRVENAERATAETKG